MEREAPSIYDARNHSIRMLDGSMDPDTLSIDTRFPGTDSYPYRLHALFYARVEIKARILDRRKRFLSDDRFKDCSCSW